MSQYVDQKHLSYAAGVGFMVVGVWTIWQASMSLHLTTTLCGPCAAKLGRYVMPGEMQ